MTPAFLPHNQLAAAVAHAAALPLNGCTPPPLAGARAGWSTALATLQRFAASPGCLAPQTPQDYGHWQAAGHTACHALACGMELGLPGDALRAFYLETVALWQDTAALARHACPSAAGVPPAPIDTRSAGYRSAVILMALAVLLDAPQAIPAIVEQVLASDTDRLLDYLSAAAMEVDSVNEDLFHPRPYGALLPFFELLGEPSPAPLLAYLHTQYGEPPSPPEADTPWLGSGWLALEVGALSVLYGWDDTALRASPHYPAAGVDFAREHMEKDGL